MPYRLILLASIGALPLWGAPPPDYERPTTYAWKAKRGDWNIPKNWSPPKVPSGFAQVYCNTPGAVIVLDAPAPGIDSAIIDGGASGSSKLIVEKKAKITLDGGLLIGTNPYLAEMELKGGSVEISAKRASGLQIGRSPTFSAKGIMTISAGTFKGAVTVGGPAVARCAGTLVIQGSAAAVEDQLKTIDPKTPCEIHETGVLKFILDEQGVTPLNYPNRPFRFRTGAQLIVEASAYKGPTPRLFPLIQAAKFTGAETLTKTITALPQPLRGEFEIKKTPRGETLYFKIIK